MNLRNNEIRNSEGEEESFEIHLLEIRWEEIGPFVIFMLFIIMSGVVKIGFHHIQCLSTRLPESCLLIVFGVLWALLVEYGNFHEYFFEFTPELFFHFLLPPIILEAAYSLYNKAFFDNLNTILLYAVVGTLFNFSVIGGLLIAVDTLGFMGELPAIPIEDHHGNITAYSTNMTLAPVEIFTFSSIISAVDPVAVLAIFSEVGVNSDLYYMVFGESLLNDGVAVVLYVMMNSFAGMTRAGEEIVAMDIVLGVSSFFTIAIGGLTVGCLFGLITALITKFSKEVRVVESLAILSLAYTAYMTAELLHWSGIISLIGCGIVQSHYAFKNISEKSHITVHYFISMLSSTMDCIIFLYLGVALLELRNSEEHFWFPGFIVWTLVLCLLVRFIGVYVLTYAANSFRMKKIDLREQFIMAYGGLRGGVGFSLVKSISKEVLPMADTFVTTVLMLVMATVWIQGSTIKPLVNLLNVDKATDEQKSLMEELNDTVLADLLPGIEIIIGRSGKHYFRSLLIDFDEKYMMKWFTRGDFATEMTRIYESLALQEHKMNLYGGLEVARQMQQQQEGGQVNLGLETELGGQDSEVKDGALGVSDLQRSPSVRMRMKSIAESVISQRLDDAGENNQRKLLSQALKEAPYKRRDKPNKNLIHDDDQDIKSHLEKRLYNTQNIWRRLSNYNVDEEERSSVRSGNSDWIQNVKQSKDVRKTSLMSSALSAWTEAGASQRGRVRTVSTSSAKQKPQDMT